MTEVASFHVLMLPLVLVLPRPLAPPLASSPTMQSQSLEVQQGGFHAHFDVPRRYQSSWATSTQVVASGKHMADMPKIR